ncbi:MAG: UDP-N-acetyl-D-mannosamine dehydrogenase [Planctomycetaceae bacterium]|nr:UDP-N-acetyl-D-mannosamine dehydrogenase [Planctomycetaceae bacterium]
MNKTTPPAAASPATPPIVPFRTRPDVCIVGLGYIGLPTAAILADRGLAVHGVDKNPAVVSRVLRCDNHIQEPGLDELLVRGVRSQRLTASDSPVPAETFVICVPTPLGESNKPDVSYVEAAARAIRPVLSRGDLILLESTSPPGATENIVAKLAVPEGWKIGQDVYIAYCPERVIPGKTVEEMIHNDRVAGGMTPACTDRAVAFYRQFVEGQVWPTNAVTAELVKLSENAFRDVNIAFANELSMLVERWGADVWDVIRLANRHPRVEILQPGPGVGGHCISVDPWFLAHGAEDKTPLIQTARSVNNAKPQHVVEQVKQLAAQSGLTKVGCLGLAYKANTNDVRESPSLEIVRELIGVAGFQIFACDPHVEPSQTPDLRLASLETVIDECEMLVLLTDHSEFGAIPTEVLSSKVLVDTRGFWRQQLAETAVGAPLRRAA